MFGILGCRRNQRETGRIEGDQITNRAIHQCLELASFGLDRLVCLESRRLVDIQPRLGVIQVGSGPGAARDRARRRDDPRLQKFALRRQQLRLIAGLHQIEITRRHPHREILNFAQKRGLAFSDLIFGLRDARALLHPKNRLTRRERFVIAHITATHRNRPCQGIERLSIDVVIKSRGTHLHIGQQLRFGLWQALAPGSGR